MKPESKPVSARAPFAISSAVLAAERAARERPPASPSSDPRAAGGLWIARAKNGARAEVWCVPHEYQDGNPRDGRAWFWRVFDQRGLVTETDWEFARAEAAKEARYYLAHVAFAKMDGLLFEKER